MAKKGQKFTTFSYEFKKKAVDMYLEQEKGYKTIAKELGLPDHSYVVRWVREYRKLGLEGLKKRRSPGRPRVNPLSTEEELTRLRAENEFLKKLLNIERS